MSTTILTPHLFDTEAFPTAMLAPWLHQAAATQAGFSDDYMHPAAVGIEPGDLGLFMGASWVGWAFGFTALAIAVISVLDLMYFGPMLAGARKIAASRGKLTHRSFAQFLTGRMQTFSGWAALMQIAFMPIALGCLMCFFAVFWLSIRG